MKINQINATHVNEVLFVSHEQIPQDAGFMQVTESNHILHTLHGRDMHRFQAGTGRDRGRISLIVNQLYMLRVGGAHFSTDGDVKFTSLLWIEPDEITLSEKKDKLINFRRFNFNN